MEPFPSYLMGNMHGVGRADPPDSWSDKNDRLSDIIAGGDVQKAREFFDSAFWENHIRLPEWEHLKIAVKRNDRPMARLLITWGASAAEQELKSLPQEQINFLRRCGLRMSAAVAARTEPALAEAEVVVREEKTETKIETPTDFQPGDRVAGEGIFLGEYAPKDRNGQSLGKIFNVFAAPQDLPGTMTYAAAVKHIAKLKDWNGFDGTNYATDKEIYAALKDGSYKGGWIIPTRELLVGTEPDGELGVRKGKVIQPDNLFDHQNKGAFKGTFKTAASSAYHHPDWYWSSTENRDNPSKVWDVRFSDGYGVGNLKDNLRLSCRPVRLVEKSPAAKGIKIPKEWRRVLGQFQFNGRDAVIAGGALRDLHNNRPVKDVDIFLQTLGSQSKNREFLEAALVLEGLKIHRPSSGSYFGDKIVLEPRSKKTRQGMTESWSVIAGPGKTEYNIIFLPAFTTARKLIESFDFGLCQIAYDGKDVLSTPLYDHDARHSKITFALKDPADTSAEHLERIVKKYPGWELCAESRKILCPPAKKAHVYNGHWPPQTFY